MDERQIKTVNDWRTYILSDPDSAVLDLARRKTYVSDWVMYEITNVVRIIFKDIKEDDQIMLAFDMACLRTLDFLRKMFLVNQGRKIQLQAAVCTNVLLSIIRAIKPKLTVLNLHLEDVFWRQAFDSHVYDRCLDLRRDMWLTLAITQQVSGVPSRHLENLFLTICEESGDFGSYPSYCLATGFVGLRGLHTDSSIQRLEDITNGVRRWVLKQKPTLEQLDLRWRSEIEMWTPIGYKCPSLPSDILGMVG